MSNIKLNTPQSPSTQPHSRRDFLSLAWKSALGISAALGLSGIVRYFSHMPNPSITTLFDLGPVDLLPRGSILVIEQAQAAIIPTKDGFEAISLVCPHLGCVVLAKKDSFDCPCHGSRFNLDGSIIQGPASEPLRKLKLQVSEEGHLILDSSES